MVIIINTIFNFCIHVSLKSWIRCSDSTTNLRVDFQASEDNMDNNILCATVQPWLLVWCKQLGFTIDDATVMNNYERHLWDE